MVEMGFEEALKLLKEGKRMQRLGWNGKGMWIRLVRVPLPPDSGLPYLEMSTAQGKIVPWVASHTDLLSEDWRII